MMKIPDFNDSELWTIQTTLEERYKGSVPETQRVETELRLDIGSSNMTPVPAIYWTHEKCNFIICKTGDERYRCQFFYRVHKMYGTGIEEYDNLSECIVTLLQVQSDYLAKENISD